MVGSNVVSKNSVKARVARDYLMQRIRTGRYRAGDRLPSERELAQALDMNTLTVRRGLKELVEEGIILKQPRVGNFVNPDLRLKETSLVAVCLAEEFEELQELSVSQFYTSGLRPALPERSYNLMVLHYAKKDFHEQAVRRAISQGCRAIVTSRGGCLSAADLELLKKKNIFSVSINRPSHLLANRMHWVAIDEQALAAELVDGLWQRGHQRILIARYTHSQSPRIGNTTLQGVFPASMDSNDVVHFLEVPNPGKTADISNIQKALHDRLPRTALIVPDELLAASVLRFCYREGVTVPRDLSLVSVQNFVPGLHPVPLTSVETRQTHMRLCGEAGKLIERHCRGETPEALGQVLAARVEWTESVNDHRGTTAAGS